MATWTDLVGYLRTNYKIAQDKDDYLHLIFNVGDERSQVVAVSKGTMQASDDEWAIITSQFGSAINGNLVAILKEASTYVVGGVVAHGDNLAIRHSVPLSRLDLNEFEEPFKLVLNMADLLEEKFFGGDDY